jgi:hypothetical protein
MLWLVLKRCTRFSDRISTSQASLLLVKPVEVQIKGVLQGEFAPGLDMKEQAIQLNNDYLDPNDTRKGSHEHCYGLAT